VNLFAFFPEIISVYPSSTEVASSSLCPILIEWSMEMLESEFSNAENLNRRVLVYNDETNTRVEINFGQYSRRQLYLTPSASNPWQPDTQYRILIEPGVKSLEGRGLRSGWSSYFKGAPSILSKVRLSQPVDTALYRSIPSLYWSPSTVSGAATGTVYYLVEVDNSPSFLSPDWVTLTSGATATPNLSAPYFGKTWYWRVTPYLVNGSGSAIASGGVSETWAFYMQDAGAADSSTRQTYSGETGFFVESTGFKSGISHQFNWPSLTLTFSKAPSAGFASYMRFTGKHVDGRTDDPNSFIVRNVSGDYSLLGNTITFTPAGSGPAFNYKFEWRVLKGMPAEDGTLLQEDQVYTFSGPYAPYYCSSSVIYADLGELAENLPEDVINFHIYMASLDAQAKWMHQYSVFFGQLSWAFLSYMPETAIRDQSSISKTYALRRWVELEAQRRILSLHLKEHTRLIGANHRLGDFQVGYSGDFIKGILEAIDQVKKEKYDWEQYLSPLTHPRTTVKSSTWSQCDRVYDPSALYRRRR
jgi:hypothetical protein